MMKPTTTAVIGILAALTTGCIGAPVADFDGPLVGVQAGAQGVETITAQVNGTDVEGATASCHDAEGEQASCFSSISLSTLALYTSPKVPSSICNMEVGSAVDLVLSRPKTEPLYFDCLLTSVQCPSNAYDGEIPTFTFTVSPDRISVDQGE